MTYFWMGFYATLGGLAALAAGAFVVMGVLVILTLASR